MENESGQNSVRCPKCGFSNSPNLKFCGNCGERLSRPRAGQMLQSLALLGIATSLYMVISVLSNRVVQLSTFFLIGYLASGLLGLYVGYGILREQSGKGLVITAAASIAVGFVFSFTLFVIAGSFVGPVWIFFVVMAWVLLKTRKAM